MLFVNILTCRFHHPCLLKDMMHPEIGSLKFQEILSRYHFLFWEHSHAIYSVELHYCFMNLPGVVVLHLYRPKFIINLFQLGRAVKDFSVVLVLHSSISIELFYTKMKLLSSYKTSTSVQWLMCN